jgi:hypothetical protein
MEARLILTYTISHTRATVMGMVLINVYTLWKYIASSWEILKQLRLYVNHVYMIYRGIQ